MGATKFKSIKSKLRICMIGEGSNAHTQKHIRFFVDLGHEVHLVDVSPFKYKSLKMHLVKNFTGIRFLDYLLRIFQSILVIRKINPDIVHSLQVTYHGFVGALSGKHPFILTPWGSDILYVAESSIFYKIITKFTIFKSDMVHCIDTTVMDRLEELYGKKIKEKKYFVLNEGVDTKKFSPKKRKEKKVIILCLRTLRETYHPLYLVEALNILINKQGQRNINAIMLDRGHKEYQEKVKLKIKEYNLSSYITFKKWIHNKSNQYMDLADIYVDTMYREGPGQGTGKTMLESMSSGLAIVAPNNPGINLYVNHLRTGLIYKGANPKSMAETIMKYVKNPKLEKRMSKNARKYILDNLDESKNMKVMEEKYFEILNKETLKPSS
ncbi:glycosyltransferase [Candidatus Woesearchaeota archaeon]|nr:glycosyltransferase [Candidatus Woesearchaeota archaeon]